MTKKEKIEKLRRLLLSSKRVALDVDDSLVDTAAKFIPVANEYFQVSLTADDYHTHGVNYAHLWSCTHPVSMQFCNDFYHEHGHTLEEMDGAGEVLIALQRALFHLEAFTYRSPQLVDITHANLGELFPGIFSQIDHFGYTLNGVGEKLKSKAEICLERSLTIIVEDNLRNASGCAAEGIMVLFLDPYHRLGDGDDLENIIPVASWREIGEILLGTFESSSD